MGIPESEPLEILTSFFSSVEKLRYMHRNPVKNGLALEPEHWAWSSYRSYAFQEEGGVKINQWPAAVMKIRHAA